MYGQIFYLINHVYIQRTVFLLINNGSQDWYRVILPPAVSRYMVSVY